MINTDIWLTLRARIETLPAQLVNATWPAWPIAYFGSTYEPQGNKPFLAVTSIKAEPRRFVVNKNIRDFSGTLSIVAVMPIGQDPAVYENVAGTIAEHFQGKLGCGTSTVLSLMTASGGTAYGSGGYRDGGWWREPVLIPWRTWN